MPRVSRLELPALDLGNETLGQRVARLRKERGFTQVELAERIGTIQTLVCDYEKDRLRLSAEMALRFALALEISVDDLLRPKSAAPALRRPNRKVLRRLEQIESLPSTQQVALLRTIDTFLEGAAAQAARRS
jgi:transcriptional regulator with XRE-family HTH domain